jgi:hypothetical protein
MRADVAARIVRFTIILFASWRPITGSCLTGATHRSESKKNKKEE